MPEGNLLLKPLSPETEPFDTPPRDAAPRDQAAIEAESLSVNVDGFEGPRDLLLTLARSQKVDLRKVSILQLQPDLLLQQVMISLEFSYSFISQNLF